MNKKVLLEGKLLKISKEAFAQDDQLVKLMDLQLYNDDYYLLEFESGRLFLKKKYYIKFDFFAFENFKQIHMDN